jgi:hypothetical protein
MIELKRFGGAPNGYPFAPLLFPPVLSYPPASSPTKHAGLSFLSPAVHVPTDGLVRRCWHVSETDEMLSARRPQRAPVPVSPVGSVMVASAPAARFLGRSARSQGCEPRWLGGQGSPSGLSARAGADVSCRPAATVSEGQAPERAGAPVRVHRRSRR